MKAIKVSRVQRILDAGQRVDDALRLLTSVDADDHRFDARLAEYSAALASRAAEEGK